MRNLTDDQVFALAIEMVGDFAQDGVEYGIISDAVRQHGDDEDDYEEDDTVAVEAQVNLVLGKLREVLENIDHY